MFARKVAIGTLLLGGSQIIMRVLDVMLVAIVARFLMPEDFGLVALATSTLLVINSVTDLPVGNALIQRKELIRADVDTAFTLSFLRGLLIGLLILALGPVLAGIYDEPRLPPIMAVVALVPVLQSLASPMMLQFARDVNYRPLAVMQVSTKMVTFLVSVGTAIALQSYWALIAGQVAWPIVSTTATYYIAPYRPRLTLVSARGIIVFTGWITVSRIIFTLNQHSDRFFIGGLVGRASLGQYTVGSDIASMATYGLAAPMMSTLFSGFSRIQDDPDRLRSAYLRGQQIMVMLLLPLGVGLSILADPAVMLLLGPQWGPAAEVIRWLAPVVALQTTVAGAQSAAMALDRTRLLAIRELIALLLRLPATVLAAWLFGLTGAVIARALTGLAVIWLNITIASRLIGISPYAQIVNCARSLASAAVMTLVLLALIFLLPGLEARPGLALACLIPAGALSYLVSHLALWRLAGKPDGAEQFVLKGLADSVGALGRKAGRS